MGHQGFDIVRLDASAIENAYFAGNALAEGFGGFSANHAVGLPCQFRRSCFPGADGPDGLVSDDDRNRLAAGDFPEGDAALTAQYVFREPGFALSDYLANADDWDQSAVQGGA